jgi:peptidyl-prolyl isomerase E (cyclophilin E)
MSNKKILFVGGIANSTTEESLATTFNTFGYLHSVQIKGGGNGDKSYAFVEFEVEEDAAAAMDNMNGAVMEGQTLAVNFAYQRREMSTKAVWDETDDAGDGSGAAAAATGSEE